MKLFLISIFGVLGVLSRYWFQLFSSPWIPGFPLGTLLINILGSFFIGLVYGWDTSSGVPPNLKLALIVGLLGGFTTFSAFSLDTIQLFKNSQYAAGFTYVFASVFLSLLGTILGLKVAGLS